MVGTKPQRLERDPARPVIRVPDERDYLALGFTALMHRLNGRVNRMHRRHGTCESAAEPVAFIRCVNTAAGRARSATSAAVATSAYLRNRPRQPQPHLAASDTSGAAANSAAAATSALPPPVLPWQRHQRRERTRGMGRPQPGIQSGRWTTHRPLR